MSEQKTSPDVSPEPRARYVSPVSKTFGILYGLLALFVLVMIFASSRILGAPGVVVGMVYSALILWSYMSQAVAIEVWSDKVVAIYPLGNTRRIPFEKIKKLRILMERTGSTLAVYTRWAWIPAVQLRISAGYSVPVSRPLDTVVDAIRESARLTRSSKDYLDRPIYERER